MEKFGDGLAVGFVIGCLIMAFTMINLASVNNATATKASNICETLNSELNYVYLDGEFSCKNGAQFEDVSDYRDNRGTNTP